jgi:hypothetical protein
MTSGSSMLAITRTCPPQPSQLLRSSWNTHFSRCAQLMARWRSAGVRVAGVICARLRLCGANTP